MMRRIHRRSAVVSPLGALAALTLALLGPACATSFSPAVVRSEIARQTGADPPRVFELNLGRITMALARQVIGPSADGSLPLAGLARFELAVYDVPTTGQSLDFTRMAVRGWEPTVRAKTPTGSTLVLVRSSDDAVGDLVLIAADAKQAIYARLAGRLSRELPEALGQAVAKHGTDGVRQELMSLAEAPGPSSDL
jgi:hypothetical protein